MRKITEQAVSAFLSGRPFHQANMVCQPETDGRVFMYLHGNRIACRYADGTIKGTLAGWPTVTTRDRLNGLARAVDGVGVYQRNHEQYTDTGEPLDADDWYTIKTA
jgi:hypothetical protein